MADEEKVLTPPEFIHNIKVLLGTDGIEWGINYDIDRDQIKLIVAVDGKAVVQRSPVLHYMYGAEYDQFREELEKLIPEPDWKKGRYW